MPSIADIRRAWGPEYDSLSDDDIVSRIAQNNNISPNVVRYRLSLDQPAKGDSSSESSIEVAVGHSINGMGRILSVSGAPELGESLKGYGRTMVLDNGGSPYWRTDIAAPVIGALTFALIITIPLFIIKIILRIRNGGKNYLNPTLDKNIIAITDPKNTSATLPLEGKNMSLNFASPWKRAGASFIDVIVSLFLGFFLGLIIRITEARFDDNQINGLSYGSYWLYFALMESSPLQATLGKLALGLEVTDLEGGRISFGKATGRHFGKFISMIILMLGFIMAFFTDKRQALHDIMSGCLVLDRSVTGKERTQSNHPEATVSVKEHLQTNFAPSNNVKRTIVTRTTPNEGATINSNEIIDRDEIYAAIAKELETGATDKGLWTRLFVECDGDENKTKLAYIKHRFEKTHELALRKLAIIRKQREHSQEKEAARQRNMTDEERAYENLPKGHCPNCAAVILLTAAACQKCQADFTSNGGWRPIG